MGDWTAGCSSQDRSKPGEFATGKRRLTIDY